MDIPNELVDDLFARTARSGLPWYETLDGDEKAFVDLVADRAREAGRLPNMGGMTRVLEAEFGDPVTVNTVRKHIVKVMRNGS
jgi:hypothetical protein